MQVKIGTYSVDMQLYGYISMQAIWGDDGRIYAIVDIQVRPGFCVAPRVGAVQYVLVLWDGFHAQSLTGLDQPHDHTAFAFSHASTLAPLCRHLSTRTTANRVSHLEACLKGSQLMWCCCSLLHFAAT
jgi:hypothetical protein